MAKKYMRSFRFSEEVYSIIAGFEGSNLSDKFDNLVKHCFLSAPAAAKEIRELDEVMAMKKKELSDLTKQVRLLNDMTNELSYVKSRLRDISEKSDYLSGQMNLFDYRAV